MQVDIHPRRATGEVADIWIHAGTGNDNNAGTAGAPLASTEAACERFPTIPWGKRVVFHYLPGHSENIARPLIWPSSLGAGVEDITLDGVDPAWDYIRNPITLQAEPLAIENVTATFSLTDAYSSLTVVTDVTKNWTPNQHAGRGLINPGAPAEHGTIWGNTATQLFVASLGYSGPNLRIVDRNATLNVGVAGFAPVGMLIGANLTPMTILGLNIVANSTGPAVDITSHGSVAFVLCKIQGGFQLRGGAGQVTVDACYLNGGAYAPNAGSLAVRQSYMNGLTANFHSVSGQYDLLGCRINACGSMGHGGTSTPHGGFRIEQCSIANGTSHGVLFRGGSPSHIINSLIESCAGNAVHAVKTGTLELNHVGGTGSTGYGCDIDLGMNVIPSGGTDVAGALGQVRLGGSGGVVYNWSQAPQSNTPRMCRFGV